MSSNMGDWFTGARGGQSWQTGGIWDALEQFRGAFEQKAPGRMGRGDVRTSVLALLAEKPMHGYQIIAEISERSGGTWKPSPGSVYPTLQLLTDEGLVTAKESDGRKTYSLTDEGRAAAEAASDRSTPWEASAARPMGKHSHLTKSGIDLAQAAAQVGRTGTAEQIAEAIDVLDDARRRLYSILAQD